MASDGLAEFLIFSGSRFQRLKVWRDQLIVTAGCIIGATVGGVQSQRVDVFAMGLVCGVIANFLLVGLHYAICYRLWKRQGTPNQKSAADREA